MNNRNTTPIASLNLTVGSIWKTSANLSQGKSGDQERIVFKVDCSHVWYGSRGGNRKNHFNQGEKSELDRFIESSSFDRNATSEELATARESLASWIAAQGI
jgi:hypothetical protein